mmetsp:Transcript_44735/g.43332  ORF Transcript_44735/g.43332 Transcript_44735/m.43332 type:complete len:82 (-) Transcript_44735:112-357(-)
MTALALLDGKELSLKRNGKVFKLKRQIRELEILLEEQEKRKQHVVIRVLKWLFQVLKNNKRALIILICGLVVFWLKGKLEL